MCFCLILPFSKKHPMFNQNTRYLLAIKKKTAQREREREQINALGALVLSGIRIDKDMALSFKPTSFHFPLFYLILTTALQSPGSF